MRSNKVGYCNGMMRRIITSSSWRMLLMDTVNMDMLERYWIYLGLELTERAGMKELRYCN